MTDKTTEALKLAENTLEDIIRVYKFETGTPVTTLAAIREALADPVKQDPVGVVEPSEEWGVAGVLIAGLPIGTKLYAAPVSAKREWVYLTDDEIDELIRKWYSPEMGLLDFAWAVIVALEEKNK